MYTTRAPIHPSKKPYMIVSALCLFALVFCCVASAVPNWSRIPGGTNGINIATTEAQGFMSMASSVSGAYTQDSVLYQGHWSWCVYYGDRWDSFTCGKAKDNGIPTYSSKKCISYFQGSRIVLIAAIVFFFLAFVVSALLMSKCGKWQVGQFWTPPSGLGALCFLLVALGMGCAIASWAFWFMLGESKCRSGVQLWDPAQGYSTSFILTCIASVLGLLALLMACMAMAKLKKLPQFVTEQNDKQEAIIYDQEPEYPVTYDPEFMQPVSYPTTQYPSTPVY